MTGIDLIGVEAVCSYIRTTGFNHFYIQRYNANSGAFPLYQFNGRNCEAAVEAFQEFANLTGTDNSNYYTITVTEVEEGEEEKAKTKRTRKYKMSFALSQHTSNSYKNTNNNNSIPDGFISRKDVEAMVRDQYELANLRNRVEQLEEEVEELEEENEELAKNQKGQPDWMNNIMSMVNSGTPKEPQKEGATLSGITDQQKVRINNAIKVLLQHDDHLDTHLIKLANLAKNDTPKFKVLLSMLDSNF